MDSERSGGIERHALQRVVAHGRPELSDLLVNRRIDYEMGRLEASFGVRYHPASSGCDRARVHRYAAQMSWVEQSGGAHDDDGVVWQPSMELRLRIRGAGRKVLQQRWYLHFIGVDFKWCRDETRSEWRDVPTVHGL